MPLSNIVELITYKNSVVVKVSVIIVKVPVINQGTVITKTCLFKYIENFTSKNWKFSDKKLIFFHISAQNIDCGYSLEPPRRGGSNEYHNLCFKQK